MDRQRRGFGVGGRVRDVPLPAQVTVHSIHLSRAIVLKEEFASRRVDSNETWSAAQSLLGVQGVASSNLAVPTIFHFCRFHP